jgi:LAO/AO transport system kinase
MSERKKHIDSALKVNNGIEQPDSINEDAVRKFKLAKKKSIKLSEFCDGIRSGNRMILSKAITLVESSLPEHQKLAQQIIENCLPYAGNSIRIGITGVPGVGKSTFIEALGMYLINLQKKVAVLAIDPSSQRTKGSILGDKTRMEELAASESAFIRPSASAGSLGGVARKTKETITLCEAAGYDTIFVETVGVGQSETAVHSMVDFFLLLMLPGAGDELQGIKRGIMEMADVIVINKADGDNLSKAKLALSQYKNVLHLFQSNESGWNPVVETCSALNKVGIEKIWNVITEYRKLTKYNGYFQKNRQNQAFQIMISTINQKLKDNFYFNEEIKKLIPVFEKELLSDKISSYMAAQKLLEFYFRKIERK